MADYYELLIKEYLEHKGFVVRLNVRFKKVRGYSDIDVLGLNSKEGIIIVGEVKAANLRKNEIDHENDDFNDPHLRERVKELLGQNNFDKIIFCWSTEDDNPEYALKNYQIRVVQFWEIIDFLVDEVVSSRKSDKWIYDQSYPNTMLLQMLYHFSKPLKGRIRIDLEKLRNQ